MTFPPSSASDPSALPRRAALVLTAVSCLALGACSTWRVPFTSAQKVPVESRLGFTPVPAKASPRTASAAPPARAGKGGGSSGR